MVVVDIKRNGLERLRAEKAELDRKREEEATTRKAEAAKEAQRAREAGSSWAYSASYQELRELVWANFASFDPRGQKKWEAIAGQHSVHDFQKGAKQVLTEVDGTDKRYITLTTDEE